VIFDNEEVAMYELWFRLAYKKYIEQKKLRVALRPSNRTHTYPKGVQPGQCAIIKIISKPGDESRGIFPEFDSFQVMVYIQKVIVSKICDMTKDQLRSCAPDCQSIEMAKHILCLIYNKEFQDDNIISLVHFDYAD
jgi:hypothetical protein